MSRVRDRAPESGHGPQRKREREGDEAESPIRGRGGVPQSGRQPVGEEARGARLRVDDEIARDDGVLERETGRDRGSRKNAYPGKARPRKDDGFFRHGRARLERRRTLHRGPVRERGRRAGGGAVGAVVRRDVGQEDRSLGKRKRRIDLIRRPLGRTGLAREVLLLERARQKTPEAGRASAQESFDDRPAGVVHLSKELAEGGMDSDVAAHDDRLAIQPGLETAQDVARRLAVFPPDDLERDAPANALAEPALDLGRARADDEERRTAARAHERLERVLEHGHARQREESGHDPRPERAECRAVAIGEEDGGHGRGIMGRRP